MKTMSFVVWQEDNQYIAQCLNAEVSSFGDTIDEAIKNLKEAVELYFQNEKIELKEIGNIFLGKETVNV
jgi:predicted RNase H-like HicB family nuclease